MYEDISKKEYGSKGEELAKKYLLDKGFRWRCSNFRTRWGEIDLVMEDGEAVVFVEVKRRHQPDRYGPAEEAITPQKQRHLVRAALLYVQTMRLVDRMLRFDVVAIEPSGVRHHPNAFSVEGDYYT